MVMTEDRCKGLEWENEVVNEGEESNHLRFHTRGSELKKPFDQDDPQRIKKKCK